jgi:hypothetical protein
MRVRPLRRHVDELARRRGLQRAERVRRARQYRSGRRASAIRCSRVAACFETRAQIAHSDSGGAPERSIGPAVAIAGVAAFGTASGSRRPASIRTYQVVNNFFAARRRPFVRAGCRFPLQRRRHHLPAVARGSYTFSSMANFLSGTYNNAGFAQTFGDTSVTQTNPNLGMYVQDEWKAPIGHPERRLRYDLQFLETIATDTNNVSPRIGFAWTPRRSQRTVVRGSAGLFYDRVRCARSPTRCCRPATRPMRRAAPVRRHPVADAGGRAGVPEHPAGGDSAGHTAEPDDHGSRPARTPIHSRSAPRSSSSSASTPRSASVINT